MKEDLKKGREKGEKKKKRKRVIKHTLKYLYSTKTRKNFRGGGGFEGFKKERERGGILVNYLDIFQGRG